MHECEFGQEDVALVPLAPVITEVALRFSQNFSRNLIGFDLFWLDDGLCHDFVPTCSS